MTNPLKHLFTDTHLNVLYCTYYIPAYVYLHNVYNNNFTIPILAVMSYVSKLKTYL